MLRSVRFFWATIALYAVNASWITLSGRYPMAHDENFHLGLIRLYSERWLPFWSTNPPGEALYGAVARDPSYLYHYLLSFPYRILQHFVSSEVGQVITLRFVSVVTVGIGIWFFRKVLLAANFSKAVTNVTLLVFCLTPMVPFFASQLNYDPVVFLCSALALYFVQQLLQTLQNTKKLDARTLLLLAIVCMFGSLIKYAFLPIALGVCLVLGWRLYKVRLSIKTLWQQFKISFGKLRTPLKITLIMSTVVLGGLFFERYGVNTIKYHTPTPECDQVIGVEACMAYSPWRRNYLTTQSYKNGTLETKYPSQNFINYVINIWLLKTTSQLFFAIDGVASNYQAAKPFRITRIVSLSLLISGSLLFVLHFRKLFRKYGIGLFMCVTGLYLGALLAQNYLDFRTIGFPYAIQGRYFLPVLPLVYVMLAQAFATTIGRFVVARLYLASAMVLLLVTQGGGASTYIQRSNPGWWWQNKTIVTINEAAQKILRPFRIGN